MKINTAITVFAFCLLFAISTAQFFGGFSGEEGADGFGYNAVNGDFGHFGGPIALTFGSQGLPPRMQGVRDARQNRGPVVFPDPPTDGPVESSGVVVGASGFGFVPPGQQSGQRGFRPQTVTQIPRTYSFPQYGFATPTNRFNSLYFSRFF